MPIRFIDRSVRIGLMRPTLADATALLSGTHAIPVGRTGSLSARLADHAAAYTGAFIANPNRVGTMGVTLGNAATAFRGSSQSDFTPPSIPTGLAVAVVSNTSLQPSWGASSDVGTGLAGYKLERSADGASGWTQIYQNTATTFLDTGLSTGTAQFYRVRSYDLAGNNSGYSLVANNTTTGAHQTAITWNPGYYALATSPNSHSTARMDEAIAVGFKGWIQVIYWNRFETARGVFDWTYPDQVAADAKARGLRYMFQIWNNSFSGPATDSLPAYIGTELAGQPGWYQSSSGGWAAKIYDSRIMDRLLNVFAMTGARYGSDPMFEGFRNGESSLPGSFDVQSDWSYANYKAQYLRLIAALPTYVPTTNAWVALNYGIQPDDMPEMCEAMEVSRCGQCGPDIYTGNTDHSTNGDRAFRGARWNGTVWVENAGKDYRGRVPKLLDTQRLEMGGTEGSPSLAQIMAHDVVNNKSNHIGISVKLTASAPVRAAPDDIYWDNTVSPASADANKQPIDILRFMPTAPSTVTAKPLIYPTVITGAGTGIGQLAAGHFWNSTGTVFESMYAVYPRPDPETNTYARHRKAYYDAANPSSATEYEIELGVEFGAWPYWYEKIAGPSWLSVGQYYGDPRYGRVYGTPTSDVTNATVTIRVHDQREASGGTPIDVTWTITTSASTNDFMFISPAGNNSNAGTYASPKLTIAGVWGTTEGGLNNPNRIVYARAGTYVTYDMAGQGFGIKSTNNFKPMALIGFPGETVNINQAAGGSICCFNVGNGTGDDFFLKNLTFTGQPTSTNYYSVRVGEKQNRITLDQLSFPNAYKGSNADNNASCIFFNSTGSGNRLHVFINRCTVTNWGLAGGGGNAWGLSCLFTVQRWLVANCSDTANRSERLVCYPKDSASLGEIRESFGTTSGASRGFLHGMQPSGGGNQGPTLVRHCRFNAGASGESYSVDESTIGGPNAPIKEIYIVRCNGIGSLAGNGSKPGDAGQARGPYAYINNVVQTPNNLVMVNGTNGALLSYMQSSGNVGASSGWLDTTTMNLTAAHQDVKGLKGAEIS